MASPGLQELAERGATRLLESELKAQVSLQEPSFFNKPTRFQRSHDFFF